VTVVDLILIVAVTWRIVRLAQLDTILDRPRMWLYDRLPDSKLAELVACPWCLSFWVGIAVVASWDLTVGDAAGWYLAAAVATASAVTGMMLMAEPGD
jgi:hypothetical protein